VTFLPSARSSVARPPAGTRPRTRTRTRTRTAHRALLLAAVGLLFLAPGALGCSRGGGATVTDEPLADGPPSGTAPATGGPGVPGRWVPITGTARSAVDGFHEATIIVTDAAGTSHEFCVLVADTDGRQERGLMYVTDRDLGGHDGMIFTFTEDQYGGFWMKNTKLPLSIAYLGGDGAIVSKMDMAPCTSPGDDCPTYPSEGAYRAALEVPQGELARLGIAGRAKVTLGPSSCPASSA
jgi:uncharacterized membrane protein (UPF0127 family)